EIVRGGALWSVGGEGYSTVGEIREADGGGVPESVAKAALLPAALCSDAVVRDTETGPGIVGDPTEAALVVAAAKAGIDAPTARRERPRLGEVPFDSAHKFMATFHRVDPDTTDRDRGEVLVCVKGAPDVVLGR